jgi:hypothetical protein
MNTHHYLLRDELMLCRYLSVEGASGDIVGRTEAIGTLELFEPMFLEGENV